jgi:hypothetical protein
MKNTAATATFASGISAMSTHRTGTWLQTGTLVFMRISRVLKTGQPAAGCESHLRNIPKTKLIHTIGNS